MSRLKLIAVGGLVAAVGCSGGNLPGGGIGQVDAHVIVDAAADLPNMHADVGSESSCPIGMSCGRAPWAAMRVDGTCLVLVRCFVEGDFTRLGVVVDDSRIPMSPAEGWTYTDDSKTVIELHGQVCSDLLSGAATTVEFDILCTPP
jgi:hypothetical protein